MQVPIFAALLIGAGALTLEGDHIGGSLLEGGSSPGAMFMKLDSDIQQGSATLMQTLATHGCVVRSEEEWAKFKRPHFPESLRNRNLVFYGDSVDRCASRHLCSMFGAKMEAPWMNGQQLPFDPNPYNQQPYHVCHLEEFGSTVLYRAHAGAMGVRKEDNWHAEERLNQMACLHRWGDSRDFLPPSLSQQHKAPVKCQVEPPWDLHAHYVLKNMLDALPKRPVILLMQSSLWDSSFAGKLLERHGKPLNFYQTDLPVQGWKWNTDGLSAWDWDQKATELVKQTRWESGVEFEKTIWRTNSNCPAGQYGDLKEFENWVDWNNDAMANVGREKVKSQDGPWSGVYLMDWRNAYDARKAGTCDGIHYLSEGYDSYVKSLFGTIDRAYRPEGPSNYLPDKKEIPLAKEALKVEAPEQPVAEATAQ